MASDEDHDRSNVDRRTYLQGIAAAGGVAGLAGLSAMSTSAQQEDTPQLLQQNQDSVVAEFCGTFSPGPQVQQCIACVEAACPDQEISPLFPLFTGLTGQCFTPDEIPEGADFVTLKAGLNCYIAPVEPGVTTFCLPPGSPDISNATFYECDPDDPQPALMDFTVTCEEITVTTMNIPDGAELTAEVTFLDADGEESTQTFTATVQNDTATFTLPGDLDPTNLVVVFDGLVLDDQEVVAEDAPCAPEPPEPPEPEDPRIEDLEVTCDAITIETTDIPEGDTIFAQVTFVGDIVETYNVPVGADGVAVIPLPGDLDPSFLQVVYDNEVLFDANVQAIDAPCAEVPPEPPDPPEPTPGLVDFSVTCEELTVITEGIPDGDVLTATVTFLDADGTETQQTFQATVQNGVAVFDLPGDLNPTNFVLIYEGVILTDQEAVAEDAPCTPEPPEPPEPVDPRIEDLEITCDEITITTTDIPAGDTLTATVTFVGNIVEVYEVTVGEDGVAVVSLPGDLDPSNLVIVYEGEILFDANVQAIDAPCAEVPPEPPEPPEPPKPPEPKPKPPKKKRLEKKKRDYKRAKREYEKYAKKYEKGRVDKKAVKKKKRRYKRKKRAYERAKKKYKRYGEDDCGCDSDSSH